MTKAAGPLRRLASQLRHRIVDVDRHWALSRGLHQLAALEPGAVPDDRVLRKLTYGWGNEAWAAGSAYLRAVIRYVGASRNSIVECGSGLSTLVAGTIARRQGREHLALEHHAQWAERVQKEIDAHGLDNVRLGVCALRSFDAFDWYDVSDAELPARIGLIICDGPPAQTEGGRYGALPVLSSHLAPDCIVLLDDTQRPEEQSIARRWRAEYGLRLVEESETFTVMSYAGAE